MSANLKIQPNEPRAARADILLAFPAVVQAQFNYTTNNSTITITGYTGPGGAVTIPDTIDGLPVTSITSPDSVTSIGPDAFAWCGFLSSATLGNGLRSIGEGAFADSGLTTLDTVTLTTLL
jgi:hypothetical protein